LSRKGHVNVVLAYPLELCREFERLNLGIVCHTEGITLEVLSTLEHDIRKGQCDALKIHQIKSRARMLCLKAVRRQNPSPNPF
jgi:hypothetical protein